MGIEVDTIQRRLHDHTPQDVGYGVLVYKAGARRPLIPMHEQIRVRRGPRRRVHRPRIYAFLPVCEDAVAIHQTQLPVGVHQVVIIEIGKSC